TPLFVSPQTTLPPYGGSGKTNTHPRYKDVALLGKDAVLNRLIVTPNPANSSINVALPTYLSEQPAVLNIYNLSGKLLKTLSIDKEQSMANIATTNLPNGIYLVSYIADGVTLSSAKVVVQH
ncbi:MAG TPA: T9SS type A sorting domain-containing protein, partial [Chitinophagales bacterium]|nr:T9SS type A sorting domain-containing protein [Chitinophagales bacterium]